MNEGLSNTFQYIEEHYDEFLEDLSALVSIPTVGVDPQRNGDMLRAATFIGDTLVKKGGIDKVDIISDYGNPIVIGTKIINQSLPTILLYAHYDVQPIEPLDLWNTDPFKMTIKNGYMYGRGVSDDKSMLMITIKAVESLLNTGNLKCNIKVLFEGDEENGSTALVKFINDKHGLGLECDTILVCDSGMSSYDKPSICTSLRGVGNFELRVISPNRDIHSGSYGGIVGNPIHALCHIVDSFHDENNHISIDGFYDGVPELTDEDHKIYSEFPFDKENLMKDIGIDTLIIEKGYSPVEAIGKRPTIEINGIYGGYIGQGGKTIIPSCATAKISFRLVGNQNPAHVMQCIEKHISKVIPQGFKYEINYKHEGNAAVSTSLTSDAYKAYAMAIEEEIGIKPHPELGGGSIGVVSHMAKLISDNIILVGVASSYDHIHSPNEQFLLDMYKKGIRIMTRMIDNLSQKF